MRGEINIKIFNVGLYYFSLAQQPNAGQGRLILQVSRSHAMTHHTLHEGSNRRRDLYLTTHNTRKKHTSIPPAGFKPASHEAIGRRPSP